MAPRACKCACCGQMIQPEDKVTIGKKNYHKGICAEQGAADSEERKQKAEDWSKLFEYVKELYQIDTLTGMMFKQIKDYKEKYGYTDYGMYYTLRYMYSVLDLPLKDDAGLGLILYYYDEAKRHMQHIWQVEDAVDEGLGEEQEIIIHAKRQPSRYVPKEKGVAHIESKIEWEEDEEVE